LLEITPQNFTFLYDFIKKTSKSFDLFIFTEITNLYALIQSKNIFIYSVIVNQEIVSAYFYRKSCVFIEKDLEILTCFGSIHDGSSSETIFIHGFKISFWKIAEKENFGFAAIENISHNHIIIHNLIKKTQPSIISPTAYFFYNFAYSTFPSSRVLITV
jgi:hypothetical protein